MRSARPSPRATGARVRLSPPSLASHMPHLCPPGDWSLVKSSLPQATTPRNRPLNRSQFGEISGHEWLVESPDKRSIPGAIREIYHVVAKRRLLNPFSTWQSTDVIIANLESVSKATHLDEFMQITATLVLFQYRYCARLIFGLVGPNMPIHWKSRPIVKGTSLYRSCLRWNPTWRSGCGPTSTSAPVKIAPRNSSS